MTDPLAINPERAGRFSFNQMMPTSFSTWRCRSLVFGVMVVLIAWTRRYMLALRERRIREQQLPQAV